MEGQRRRLRHTECDTTFFRGLRTSTTSDVICSVLLGSLSLAKNQEYQSKVDGHISLSTCFRLCFVSSYKVRVKPASKSSAGKTLSREDVPESEWKQFGLAPPIPEVGQRSICSCKQRHTRRSRKGRSDRGEWSVKRNTIVEGGFNALSPPFVIREVVPPVQRNNSQPADPNQTRAWPAHPRPFFAWRRR